MKTFKIYKHANSELEVVKIGFSWPAFFFFVFWMASKRMWILAAVSMVLHAAYELSSRQLENIPVDSEMYIELSVVCLLSSICSTILWLGASFRGNKWREANLVRRGYQYLGLVTAPSADDARSRAGFAAGLSSGA